MEKILLLIVLGVNVVFAGLLLNHPGEKSTTRCPDNSTQKNLPILKGGKLFDNRSRMANGMGWYNCRSCGIVQRTRIVGGRKASIRDYPWMVAIHKSGVQHCGASVIDNVHILTAAHCVYGLDLSQLVIIASATNVYSERAFRARIQSFVTHPQFEPETYDYDIALLTLDKHIPLSDGTIRPVCLPDPDDDPTGGVGVVSGWGATTETANVAPEELRKVELPIISLDQCHKAQGLRNQKLTDRMMCAGFIRGNMDACSGDSGGPLVWEQRGRWKQVGVVSWGIGCARPEYYGVFTKLTAMLSWIGNNIENSGCD